MAAIKFKVVFNDGRTEEALVTPKVQVLLERHFKTALTEKNMKLEHLYFLAYTALKQKGANVPSEFDHFLDEISEVEDMSDLPESADEIDTDPTLTGV